MLQLAHISGSLMQYLQHQQDMVIQFFKHLKAVAPICHGCLGSKLTWVVLQKQGDNTTAGYPGLHP